MGKKKKKIRILKKDSKKGGYTFVSRANKSYRPDH